MNKVLIVTCFLVLTTAVATLLTSLDRERLRTSLASLPDPLRSGHMPGRVSEGIAPYLEYMKMVRANQLTGEVDAQDVIAAREQALALMRQGGHRSLGLQWEPWGPNNIGGRTRAILIDPNNPSRIYTGGVSGGLWLSDNGGESWYPYLGDDTLAGVGVASLCRAANGDIYVGTGEPGQKAGQDSYTISFIGGGIWKSTDGGKTFQNLPSTKPTSHNNPSDQWVSVVALGAHPTNPDVLLAGTERGVMVTEDGGNTWVSLSTYNGNSSALGTTRVSDIKVDHNGLTHICGGGRYYRGSINDFAFESLSSSTITGRLPQIFQRLMIDLSKSDPNYVYAVGCNSAGQTSGVYRSTDAGLTWITISPLGTPNAYFNPTGNQGWYDMWIGVNPTDKNRIYILGQINIWKWTSTKGWYPVSETGGNSGTNPYYVHADHHVAVFHPTNPNILYIGGDGGIFRTTSALAEHPQIPTWKMINKGYQTAQFFAVAAGLNGATMGGTQDNGTLLVDFSGNSLLQGRRVNGGDGGFTEISKTNPEGLFATSQFGAIRRSSNGGNSMARYMDQNIDEDQNGSVDCGAPFVTPFRLYEELRPDLMNLQWYQDNASVNMADTQFVVGADTTHVSNIRKTYRGEGRMILGTNCGAWLGTNALDFSETPTWFRISTAATTASMELAPGGDMVYVGTTGGRLYRISGLLNARLEYVDSVFNLDASGIQTTLIHNFGRYICGVAVDKNNPGHVVVCLGNYGYENYLYRSTVADTVTTTGSFTSIQGNLPQMPCYDVVIDYYNPDNIIVATEIGIYSMTLPSLSWSYEGNGIPASPALSLRQEMFQDLDGDCYVLYAGTHGRGFYRSTTLTPAHCNANVGVKRATVPENELMIYPNPARDVAMLGFTLTEASRVELNMYNLHGQIIRQRNLGSLNTGYHLKHLPLQGITAGQYLVVVRVGDARAVGKLIVN